MLTPKQAKELSQEKRLEIAKGLISKQVEEILDREIIAAIATSRYKVDITLRAKDCKDSDGKIEGYLAALGYEDIRISSDFPGYCETYEGKTRIKFRVP